MASYIGVSPPEQTGIIERYRYTGDGSTTVFSGNDVNGKQLRYTSTNPLLVFLNGVQLIEDIDFTKTSNTQVTFTTAPASNDDIEMMTFGSYDLQSPSTTRDNMGLELSDGEIFVGSSSDLTSKVTPSGDATISNTGVVTVASAAGDFSVSCDLSLSDSSTACSGDDNDLSVYHNGSTGYIAQTTGSLYIRNYANDQDIYLQSDDGSGGLTTYLTADGSTGQVQLNHYGNLKLTTYCSGICVLSSGSATSDSVHDAAVRIKNTDSTDDNYSALVFDANAATGSIEQKHTDRTNNYGEMYFFTRGTDGYQRRLKLNNGRIDLYENTFVDGDLTVDTNTLHVDSTNNRVGIGTTSSSTLLHLSSTDPKITITDTDGTGSQVIKADTDNLRMETPNIFQFQASNAGTIQLLDSTTYYGKIFRSGGFKIESVVADQDIFIRGNDGGVFFDALSFDMSEQGNATFNNNVSVGGNATITGNLTVNGTTTTINTATLDVEDLNITVACGAASAAASDGAGITVDGAAACLTYGSTCDAWACNKGLGIGTTSPATKLHVEDGEITISDGTTCHQIGNDGNQIYFGADALSSNSGGLGNIDIGYQAMCANVSGCYNTAVGHQALVANVSDAGSYNTAHGYQALYSNTTGSNN